LIEQRRVIREPAERDRHGPSVSPASCQPFPTTGPSSVARLVRVRVTASAPPARTTRRHPACRRLCGIIPVRRSVLTVTRRGRLSRTGEPRELVRWVILNPRSG
jgi:hypothetical protein